MISESDEDGFVKIGVPKNPSFFFIEKSEWDNLKK